MGISTDRNWRQQLIFISILLMLAALFTSRYLLSVGMIFFLLLTCLHQQIPQQLRIFVNNSMLTGIALLFFIPFITWYWSEDQQEWARWARIKLPLFLLPVAFAGQWQLTSKQWGQVAWFFLCLVFAGCSWSLYQYLQHHQEVQASYLKAKVMDTPLDNDHVRFSLIVCLSVLCSVQLLLKNPERTFRIILFFLIAFFVVYLHILSARTGLLGLYILLGCTLFYMPVYLKKHKWVPVILLITLLMPIGAWLLVPTFQNRISYFLYDVSLIKHQNYLPGSNDGNRFLSLRAGWNILSENPLGVGSGDVVQETNKWYQFHMPQLQQSDKLYPSSEWLLYGDAAGWPGVLLFSFIMLIPFFVKIKQYRFLWIMMNMVIVLSLLFDIGLETQFGVFIYAFIILCWWKWILLNDDTRETGTV